MIDLEPVYLERVCNIIKRHLPGIPVWAFGSRVNGLADSGSDLDLVVHIPEGQQLTAVREAFRESNIPIAVELIDWCTIPEHFRHEILKKYEVLQ